MCDQVKVSVVIPTYKRPFLLGKCLVNLSRQRFPKEEFEAIVVTDGPDESTMQLCDRLRGSLNLNLYCYSLPAKAGPATARNLGWKKALGELILFTDDDCLPEPGWVPAFWTAHQNFTGVCQVMTGRMVVPIPHEPTDYEQNIARLETAAFVTANCACPKICLEQVGGFDEEFETAWREDSDLHFKLMLHEIPIVKIADAVVIHPARLASWGVSLKEQRKSMYNALLFKKYPRLFREHISRYPKWSYYLSVASALCVMVAAVYHNPTVALVAAAFWLFTTITFARKRLQNTSKAPLHVAEMIFTSALIPFLSVFWTLRGSVRYKTWFL